MSEFYEIIGDRIRQARKARGWVQADLAKAIGLSRPAIGNIECGRQHVMVHQLYWIAEALRVSPARLAPPLKQRDWLRLVS